VRTKIPALAPNYTPVGEVLFTFAHHFGKYFRYLGFRDVKTESTEARRNLAARAIRLRVSLRQTPHNQGDA
jgi:hypothetical protein